MKDVHDLLAAQREFTADCSARAPAGARIARVDSAILGELAAAIRASAMIWADLFADLDLAACGRFDRERASLLVAEGVFDEVLEPSAWRVLKAALGREEVFGR
jgi:hypothetical protein